MGEGGFSSIVVNVVDYNNVVSEFKLQLSYYIYFYDVMVIVLRNEHGDPSSNAGRGWLHYTYH